MEQAAEPVKPAVPGGEPITLDVARVKKNKIKLNGIHLYLTPATCVENDAVNPRFNSMFDFD